MTDFASSNGSTKALLDVHPDGSKVVILHIEVETVRRGDGRRSLQELRAKYPGRRIVAYGVGHPNSDSCRFWVQMHREGLVDDLLDDDGEPAAVND